MGSAKTYPALELFDGLMYRSIERQDLSGKGQAYLQEHLLITICFAYYLPKGLPPSIGFYDEAKPAENLKGTLKEDYASGSRR